MNPTSHCVCAADLLSNTYFMGGRGHHMAAGGTDSACIVGHIKKQNKNLAAFQLKAPHSGQFWAHVVFLSGAAKKCPQKPRFHTR